MRRKVPAPEKENVVSIEDWTRRSRNFSPDCNSLDEQGGLGLGVCVIHGLCKILYNVLNGRDTGRIWSMDCTKGGALRNVVEMF